MQDLFCLFVVSFNTRFFTLHFNSDQEWIAELEGGSHIVYVWSLDGVAGTPTTINKVWKHLSATLSFLDSI